MTKALRDEISKVLGKDEVIHITLNVDKEAQKARLQGRHGQDAKVGRYFSTWYELYELVDEVHENGFVIDVSILGE